MFNGKKLFMIKKYSRNQKPIIPSPFGLCNQSYTEWSSFIKLCSMHLSAPLLMAISVTVKCQILGKIDSGRGFDILTYHSFSSYSKQPLLKGHHHCSAYIIQNVFMVSLATVLISEPSAICVCNHYFPFNCRKPLYPISFAFFPLLSVTWL